MEKEIRLAKAYEQDRLRVLQLKMVQKAFTARKNKRLNIFLHTLLTFTCQMVLVITIARYILESSSFTEHVDLTLLFSRFICGTILHLSLLGEVTRGMQNMKFVLNHPYLF